MGATGWDVVVCVVDPWWEWPPTEGVGEWLVMLAPPTSRKDTDLPRLRGGWNGNLRGSVKMGYKICLEEKIE